MKQTDFDRLKAVCEKEGFEVLNLTHDDNEKYVLVKKQKYIWEEVEFVEALNNSYLSITKGKIYKVRTMKDIYGNIGVCVDDRGLVTNGWRKSNFKPSTESAYVEQLKAEAFKRFGEIKENQVFIEPDGKSWYLRVNHEKLGNRKWCYEKEFDKFYFYSLVVYEKGKWATRVKEKVKVEPNLESIAKYVKEVTDEQRQELRVLLASKLEEYLNKESE